ncbi:hypothetical protein HN873_050069 [Arachis hypogaea]|uniref:F-box domain-containing protein n=1 Tax=Arachis hypogaea TaxID=3818 RepID=A0A444WNC9_ARAHY|nr:F-box/kelch-repeat protein [Arachis hypogaea]RYQ79006.1 hypothetical protein Ahy_Scaffold8g108486 [Arachis hypogaea]
MEQNNNSSKSINDMLPPELITQILLRLSVKHLGRVKSVSKFWNNLISNPNFAKSHFELSLAPTHRCIFIPEVTTDHRSIDLDALSHATYADAAAATITKIPPSPAAADIDSDPDYDDHIVLGSCRGFIALYQYPHSFVIWNPLTGSHRIISCHHIAKISDMATNCYYSFGGELLFGFGYDTTRDDYLIVLAWNDEKKNQEGHFDFFSLRSNSWSSFKEDVIIPDQLKRRKKWAPSVFFNGAIHWLNHDGDYDAIVTIFVFDTNKRKGFLEIPVPEQVGRYYPCHLTVLGGCLALYYEKDDDDYDKSVIWVMKEYNVQSSWTSYEIPSSYFEPVCLSEDGDFIGFDESPGMSKYNVRGEKLMRFDRSCNQIGYVSYTVYTESLLMLPNDGSEEKEGSSSVKGTEESTNLAT